MKKEVIFGAFIILLIGIVSATPYILFVSPTPSNGAETTGSSVVINSTIENLTTMQEFIFQWSGTNYSLYDEDLILMLNLNNNSNLGENDTLVYDSSRFGHNGTITGTILSDSGKYQGGLSVDADNEFINLSDHADFRSESFTISFWYNKTSINIQQVSAFGDTTCLLNSGVTYCVGDNDYGQLGDGTSTDSSFFKKVLGNYEFDSLCQEDYSESYHVCGLLSNGTGLCWGSNSHGQLGIGNSTDMYVPYYIYGGYNFSNLHCGRRNTCGLLQNGSALCWGENVYGALGLGNGNTTTMYVPTYVSGNNNFKSLSAGDQGNCGLLHNGSAMCWGRNDNGQLGNGSEDINGYLPTLVSGGQNFTSIYYGNQDVHGIILNGSLMGWGASIYEGTDFTTPVSVYGAYNFSYFEPGYGGGCALLTNGSALTWGLNDYGQLGSDSYEDVNPPNFVYINENFSSISVGESHGFGITNEGDLMSWGGGSPDIALGKGYSSEFNIPVVFKHYDDYGNENFSSISLAIISSCGILTNGSALCWGNNYRGQAGAGGSLTKANPPRFIENHEFSSISKGVAFTCGLLSNGSALCWGLNIGNLGIGNTTQMHSPTYVLGGHNFSSISMGYMHSCGLLQNDSVLCWGRNNYGQLGIGSTTTATSPDFALGGYNFKSISLGYMHSCGLLHNGSAMCWGWNNYGQLGLGNGNTTNMRVPTYISGGYNFSILSSGEEDTCGLLHNGSALCWGRNNYGQLGIGDGNTTTMYSPTYVLGGHNFTSISAGKGTFLGLGDHTCGIVSNGSALCWGENKHGQLGIGNNVDKGSPSFVDINQNFSSIYSGGGYTFGILENGKVVSWGDNFNGQQFYHGYNFGNSTKGIYKGKLIGKGINSFEIASSFSGDLKFLANNGIFDLDINSGWNSVILSFNGTTAKIYVNGELNTSFDSPAFDYLTDTSFLTIGDDIRGQVDEIMMWNRTLTATEVQKVYESSLYQKNHTAWEFYSVQSLPSVGTYTYKLFAKDSTGWFNILRRIIKIATSTDDGSGGGGYISPSYVITEEKLQEGHSRWLRENNKIKLEFSSQGSKTLEVTSVNNDLVKVEVNNIEVEVTNGTTEKIDVDNDGFYDLELSLLEISESGSGHLMFKEIYEEIDSEISEGVNEEQKEDSDSEGEGTESGEELIDGKRTWFYYVIGGILVLGFIVFFSLWKKKR